MALHSGFLRRTSVAPAQLAHMQSKISAPVQFRMLESLQQTPAK